MTNCVVSLKYVYMKKRSSIDKAEWSEKRSESYREYCEKILYDKGLELSINGTVVHITVNKNKTVLFEITSPKSMWFEIWLKLRDIES